MPINKKPWSLQFIDGNNKTLKSFINLSVKNIISLRDTLGDQFKDGYLLNANTGDKIGLQNLTKEFLEERTYSEQHLLQFHENLSKKFHAFTQKGYDALSYQDFCIDEDSNIYLDKCLSIYHKMNTLFTNTEQEMREILRDCGVRTLWIRPPLNKENPLTPILFQPYGV